MTQSASSTRTEWTAAEFQAELVQFRHALRAAGLREATIHAYLTGSSRFVRWLAGEYIPGPGRAAPAARANPAPKLGLGDRDAAIVLAREQGDTLQEIAIRFGISRERVRQILITGGGTPPGDLGGGEAGLASTSSVLSTVAGRRAPPGTPGVMGRFHTFEVSTLASFVYWRFVLGGRMVGGWQWGDRRVFWVGVRGWS